MSSFTLAVCGDSWFTCDTRYPNASFPEIVCNHNGWNLQTLARGGCSNFGIALQVDRAIQSNPDFILVGTTTPDRMEIPIINDSNLSVWQKLKGFFNWNDWSYNQPEVYNKSQGIDNVWYKYDNDLSKKFQQHTSPTIIAESINNLIFTNPYDLDNARIEALKLYATELYDNGIKRQIDCWIISDACRRLVNSGIPFLIYIEPLFDPGDHYQTGFKQDIEWADKKNLIEPWDFSYYNLNTVSPAIFHYALEDSKKFADYINKRINEGLK